MGETRGGGLWTGLFVVVMGETSLGRVGQRLGLLHLVLRKHRGGFGCFAMGVELAVAAVAVLGVRGKRAGGV